MADSTSYVRTDEHGVMRVAETRVSLDSVVIPFQNGDSPESIRSQYPSLTLEQVYGAITYYLGHKAEVDEYLRRQEIEYNRLRAEQEAKPNALRDRLRSLKAGLKAGHGP